MYELYVEEENDIEPKTHVKRIYNADAQGFLFN